MQSSAPASRISLLGSIKSSIAVAVIGAAVLLAIIQWTALTVQKHIGIVSLSVFPAALDSQQAGTAFERMNSEYSDAVVMQEKKALASADQEAATVVSSLDRAAVSMAFNSERRQQIVSLKLRVADLRARSRTLYATAAEVNATPPKKEDLAGLSRENKEVKAALDTLLSDLASDFKAELALINKLLRIQGILEAVVLAGVIVALFFSSRTLIKATIQRREDEVMRQTHAALDNERRILRTLIDNIPDFMYVKDTRSRFMVANLHLARVVGAETPEELLGKTDFDFFPREQAASFFADEQGVIRSGKPLYNRDEKGTDGAGKEIHLLTTKVPLLDSEGHILGIAGVSHDITSRKRMEEALREAEQKYREIFDKAVFGIFQTTLGGRFLSVNSSMALTLGYDSPGDMIAQVTDIGRQFYVDPERRKKFMLLLEEAGVAQNFECELRRKDGRKIWITMSARAIRENGALVSCEGVIEDITARKKMEIALREAEQKYRSIFDTAVIGIFQSTPEGRILSVNRYMKAIYGFGSKEEPIERNSNMAGMTYVDSSRRDEFMFLMENTGSVTNFECEHYRKDGSKFWVSVSAVAVRENGEVVRYEGMCQDITDSRKMEDALREAEQKYRGIFDKAVIGIFQSTPDGYFLSVNPSMAFTLGYNSPDEVIAGITDISRQFFVSPKRGVEFMLVMDKVGGVKNFECEVFCKDGHKIWLTMSIRAIRQKGVVVRYEGMCEDITERILLREQLLQAQKLESVGQLAAGIAHEINTPTQYIGDNVRFLKDAFEDMKSLLENYERLLSAAKSNALSSKIVQEVGEAVEGVDTGYLLDEIPKAIEQTLEGVSRVSTIVSAMKEFSHPDIKEKVPTDLNRAVNSTITVARNEWKYVADLETDFDASLPPVPCLPGEFNQVILNLIVNAAHAIGDATRKGGPAMGKIKVQTINCVKWVEIRIQDSGTGIPEKVQSRIFDPFFTTKEIGKGTGQGLAIARSVVITKHGGSIHFETEEGKGTTFIIRLPYDGMALSNQGVAA
jgi:PAS domain S-box-containing protein